MERPATTVLVIHLVLLRVEVTARGRTLEALCATGPRRSCPRPSQPSRCSRESAMEGCGTPAWGAGRLGPMCGGEG